MSGPSTSEPRVASNDELLDAKAALDGLLLDMAKRSAKGKAVCVSAHVACATHTHTVHSARAVGMSHSSL